MGGTRHKVGSGKTRSRVAVVRTRPESVLDDVAGRSEDAAEGVPVGHFIQTPFTLRGGPFAPRIYKTIRKC